VGFFFCRFSSLSLPLILRYSSSSRPQLLVILSVAKDLSSLFVLRAAGGGCPGFSFIEPGSCFCSSCRIRMCRGTIHRARLSAVIPKRYEGSAFRFSLIRADQEPFMAKSYVESLTVIYVCARATGTCSKKSKRQTERNPTFSRSLLLRVRTLPIRIVTDLTIAPPRATIPRDSPAPACPSHDERTLHFTLHDFLFQSRIAPFLATQSIRTFSTAGKQSRRSCHSTPPATPIPSGTSAHFPSPRRTGPSLLHVLRRPVDSLYGLPRPSQLPHLLCFQTIPSSFVPPKTVSSVFSCKSELFAQNTRGGHPVR